MGWDFNPTPGPFFCFDWGISYSIACIPARLKLDWVCGKKKSQKQQIDDVLYFLDSMTQRKVFPLNKNEMSLFFLMFFACTGIAEFCLLRPLHLHHIQPHSAPHPPAPTPWNFFFEIREGMEKEPYQRRFLKIITSLQKIKKSKKMEVLNLFPRITWTK